MSSLTDIDKRYLEKLFGMPSGYVLDYSDATYGEFFGRHNIDIHGRKYQTYGTSKAKKMRAFWEQEPDKIVAPVLNEMLTAHEVDCDLNDKPLDKRLFEKCSEIITKISGGSITTTTETVDAFLEREFTIPNLDRLPVEPMVASIIQARLAEARKALNAGASLSVIFLCGSVLEGVLLGVAQSNPVKFNRSSASPKDEHGKVRPYHQWTLSQFIDVACDVGILKLDVKKFSHGLRDFRNYIHPYEQMASGFAPDEHTAKVCFQVLKAALASVAGTR
ncbi:hypothetical protein OF122_03570 [Pelagibacterium flavum]|uniref:Uncharacterized protein n=1 Tax=Pelagibacterium flavum TaxID=2984530 RepID=A0ABY6IQX8_9HYPH|nr:hypothetical protein [Pelagibacterium sp. YIM 151497]UYQ72866.1 hypothetical protein OF122_03570 [Pelagibacterium sp. YIM 151497]